MLYTCSQCDKAFRLKRNFNKHLLIHTKELPYRCNICDKAFYLVRSLKTHMLVHTGKKPYSCIRCRKTFNNESNMSRHMLVHTVMKPYNCNICDEKFKYEVDWNTHMLVHTEEEANSSNIVDINDINYLRSHMLVFTGRKPYLFKICDKVIKKPSVDSLDTHLIRYVPTTPYLCNLCDKAFEHINDLERHYVTPYLHERRDEPISIETNFPTHCLDHTAGEPYSCNRCNMKFKDERSLETHTLVYYGRKTYYFKKVDRSFAQSTILNSPLIMNTAAVTYSCDACRETFRTKIDMTYHMLLHSEAYSKKNRRGTV